MVEDGDQKWGSLQSASRDPQGFFRVGRSRTPGFGPEGVTGNLERNRSNGKIEGGSQMQASAGGAPVREAGAHGQASGEEGAKVRGECEAELGFGAGEFGVGQARLDLNAGGAEVGDDFVGERGVGEEAVANGKGSVPGGG